MDNRSRLGAIAANFQSRFAAHTILLYGSAANGTATPESDLDIAAFGPVERAVREAYVHEGIFVDGFVYSESVLRDPEDEHLRFRGAIILLQHRGTADAFMGLLERKWVAGPAALPADEQQARRVWIEKMLRRTRRGDAEGNYRRAWLLTSLLEDYFLLRNLWFEGPKKALLWLERHDPVSAEAISAALVPGADFAAIERAAQRVLNHQT
ncbi:nucleotidyltransferase domain-containing protein [Salinicola rhizosphaerae]|uniref:Polymerase nucleotidyl transferase domain-containing protein n=1 Tax=Salinicola rhizosphaerae TaxID=1443141 RepID=A0ABQ3DW24_9GAMM|nr:nucleotidyltransferase domain-containing protein [Salinicola rhizosphaerae]GHB13813.1 hypothetical protein GCM10009038_10140 [Salinicola rhizosphaerae]